MKKYSLLLVFVILAGVLRTVDLSKYPSGFTPDEADFGYNAYSILQTGRDEWGTAWYKLPFTNLRSFGDYKLPLYSFLAIPSIAILGLNEFATRLPNALFGTLSVVAICLFVKELFPKEGEELGLICAALMAISPWSIQLSRGAFESNLITFFLPLGMYFLLKKKWIFSAIILAINFYSYHTARFLTPLAVLLGIWYVKPAKAGLIKFLLVLFILTLPGLISFVGGGATRAADVGIFNPTDNWSGVSDRRFEARNSGLPDSIAKLFSNKPAYLISLFTNNYLAYLSPQFLVISGPSEATYGMIPGQGVIYLVELVGLGMFVILLVRRPTRAKVFLMLLLLASIVPASLAKGLGLAANRVAPMLTFLLIMFAVSWGELKNKTKLFLPLVCIIYLGSLAFFAENYIYHAPRLNAPVMSYGWAELMPRLKGIAAQYDSVKFSRVMSEPQIFVAFYGKIPPSQFQIALAAYANFNLHYKFLDQMSGIQIGKYWFGDINPEGSGQKTTLFIGPPGQFPQNFPEYFHIDYPGGPTAIKVAHGL